MNRKITELYNHMKDLDQYTKLAVYGSWAFAVNAAAINAAVRYVPDEPVDNGIETFTQYDAGRRKLMEDAEQSTLPHLISLSRTVQGWIEDEGGEVRGIDDTLAFLTNRAPDKKQFEADYEQRRRMGMRPQMSLKAFVDSELDRAMAAHNKLVARGEDAVRLCNTTTIDGADGDTLPDWLMEAFQSKMISKLHSRWEKSEISRTNPRLRKEQRDGAAADQMLIAKVLAAFDEYPGMNFSDDDDKEPVKPIDPKDEVYKGTELNHRSKAPAPAGDPVLNALPSNTLEGV